MSELFREALRRYQQDEETRPSQAEILDLRTTIQFLQRDARRAGLNKVTMREINAEIAAARKEIRSAAEKPQNQANDPSRR